MHNERLRAEMAADPTCRLPESVLVSRAPDPYQWRYGILADQIGMMHYLRKRCTPLIRRALALPGVTAWVAYNDMLALLLLDVLKSEGIAVPGRLSVASFDDVPDAFNVGLTSYNFNVPAIVEAMVDHILGGPSSRHLKSQRIVEIPGYVVERSTTTRAPG
jgi:DNA-binding LacI/PurR family transcriptional regulator